jgi:ABC-2 type transport system permease protein
MTASGSARPSAASSATGSIFDLGYRRYSGPRLGRRHAVAALFRYSLRACFGIGRGGRAKLVPLGILVLALLPALVSLGFIGLVRRVGAEGAPSPIGYDTYYTVIAQLLFLFAAAQGPELLGRDLRHGVLALYFSRALRRTDYALAKLGALFVAILAVQLIPQAIIFVGRALVSTDIVGAVRADADQLPPILAQSGLAALLLASIALAAGSFASRRAYATAAIIALFVIPPIVAGVVGRFSDSELRGEAALLSPPDLLSATNDWLFHGGTTFASANGLEGDRAFVAALVLSIVALVVLLRRYQRIAA